MRYLPIAAAIATCIMIGLLSGCDSPPPTPCMKVGEVGEVVFNQPGSRPIMGRYQTTQQPTTTVKVRMITDGVAGGRQAGTVRICRIDGDTMTPYQPGDRVNLTQMARIM